MQCLLDQQACKAELLNGPMQPYGESKMTRFIGLKCIINCCVNRVANCISLDNLTQVSLVSRHLLD